MNLDMAYNTQMCGRRFKACDTEDAFNYEVITPELIDNFHY